jgi:hypothetical protein
MYKDTSTGRSVSNCHSTRNFNSTGSDLSLLSSLHTLLFILSATSFLMSVIKLK